jgi:CheY-like chemotaxis protein
MDTTTPTNKTILIVEDNDSARTALASLLRREGYAVQEAVDGRQALDSLLYGPRCDVVLLDMLLPQYDGWHFLRERKQMPALAGIPVIITTGVDDFTQERAEELGAVAYLRKPLEPAPLLETIRWCH